MTSLVDQTIHALRTSYDTLASPGQEVNQPVWDRWDAMTPRQQAQGYLQHDELLVAAYEQIDSQTRETLRIQLGVLPMPLPLAAAAGMRLNEAALHLWDVLVAFDPTAAVEATSAQVLAEQLSGPLSFLSGFFFGKADQYDGAAVVALGDNGFALSIDDTVSITHDTTRTTGPTPTFTGPLEAAVWLLGSQLTPARTPDGVEVTGGLGLEDLRKISPGY